MMRNLSRKEIIGILFVILLAVLSIVVLVRNNKDNKRDAVVTAQRAALHIVCRLTIKDRLDTIQVRETQARSAQAISDDPFQSAKTRKIRGAEAVVLRTSVARLKLRVDPDHGGKLVC